MTPEDKLLSKKQVASTLSLSVRTIERLIASGKLSKVKIQGAVRFRFSDVKRIMEGGAA